MTMKTLTERESRSAAKVAVVALAGASIEWYDFFLYGVAAALVFPVIFFPKELPPLLGLIAAFSTFAVGFLARPIGGVVFGHFGDRHGRKAALVTALLIMGAATALIGCLPSYEMVGAWAPLTLIVLRFMQGLAIGGQWGGAMLLAVECAPSHRRGLYGGFAQAGAPVGVVLSNLVFLVVSANLSQEQFIAWGWRVPFLLSVVLVGLGLYIQLRLEDTPAFRSLKALKRQRDERLIRVSAAAHIKIVEQSTELTAEREPSPVLQALKTYPKQIALAAGAFVAVQVTFYILVAFVVAYGASSAGLNLPRDMMLQAALMGAIAMIPGVFVSAAASDRMGRRGIYIAGAVLLGLWAFALFPLIETKSFVWIAIAISVGQVFVSMMYGPQAAFLAEMFSTKMRFSGASLGYQLGAIVGGALAPLIATALLARFGNSLAISVYIALACAITVVSVLLLKETYRTDLDETREYVAHSHAREPVSGSAALIRSLGASASAQIQQD
jgi:MFS family permease